MGRFNYALQVALDRFCQGERLARCTLAEAERVLASERRAIAEIDAMAHATKCSLRIEVPTRALALVESSRRLDVLDQARNSGCKQLKIAELAVAAALAELEHANRKRSVLERHRARKLSEFLVSEALRDAADIDEANSYRKLARRGD